MDNVIIYYNLFRYTFRAVNNNNVIIYYSPDTFPLLLLRVIAKLKGIKIYKEQSEHPDVHLKDRVIVSRLAFKYLHFKLFDGLLLMTESLINHFRIENILTKSTLHVPMTVELDRFSLPPGAIGVSKEIMYTGMLDDEKDGTNILIKAFSIIAKKHPGYVLSLFGEASSEVDAARYVKMVQDLNIADRVRFHGVVSRDSITERMVHAAILVLPRPDSLQAQNGFPTKLGEYLATGIPVIATAVGEIPNYLNDNESVFMARPGDVDSLVEKFDLVVSDYKKALEIAEQGRLIAHKNFSNIKQTASIIAFVERDTG